jgi:hypothetical protein
VHVVVWCTERCAIAAAACVLDPRDARAPLRAVDGHHDGRAGTIDVARSFVSVGFGDTDAAVALLRGIEAWLSGPAASAAAAE